MVEELIGKFVWTPEIEAKLRAIPPSFDPDQGPYGLGPKEDLKELIRYNNRLMGDLGCPYEGAAEFLLNIVKIGKREKYTPMTTKEADLMSDGKIYSIKNLKTVLPSGLDFPLGGYNEGDFYVHKESVEVPFFFTHTCANALRFYFISGKAMMRYRIDPGEFLDFFDGAGLSKLTKGDIREIRLKYHLEDIESTHSDNVRYASCKLQTLEGNPKILEAIIKFLSGFSCSKENDYKTAIGESIIACGKQGKFDQEAAFKTIETVYDQSRADYDHEYFTSKCIETSIMLGDKGLDLLHKISQTNEVLSDGYLGMSLRSELIAALKKIGTAKSSEVLNELQKRIKNK